MRNNTRTNSIIMYMIIVIDIIILNTLLFLLTEFHSWFQYWTPSKVRTLLLLSNIALIIAEYFFSPIIQKRVISVGDILKRVIRLALTQSFFAFFFMKSLSLDFIGGRFQSLFCLLFFFCVLISRAIERYTIKSFRQAGGNIRYVTFVGSDPELLNIYHRLYDDASKGYEILGYYADEEMDNMPINIKLIRLGSMQELLSGIEKMEKPKNLSIGDELYVCISRREHDIVRKISSFCNRNVVRFYFVPMSVEVLGIDLKRELLDDMEVFTTYESPLDSPLNMLIKRLFDIVLAILALLLILPFLPIIWLIIKIQSPGPLFFKQVRTGMDGKSFNMLKFRSMHVNADADRLQATKDDPRKYPFGNFMRKANIDELPQFWNVLMGDMSIVGPRPHMLAHTEQYSQLIDKYMVRHFVKPGVTGWAQVTGFRGETKELWQMEGRVKRDIWYIEHWSIWLDIRIIWMTVKSMIIPDKNAY